MRKLLESINAMSITKKTSLLFLNMVVGMLFLGSFAHFSINSIKNNFDTLYTKSIVPLIDLQRLKSFYRADIHEKLAALKDKEIALKDAKTIIRTTQKKIAQGWINYTAHAQSKQEFVIIEKASQEMLQMDDLLEQIFEFFAQGKSEKEIHAKEAELRETFVMLNVHLTKLATYGFESASNIKEKTQVAYNYTFEWILAATIGTISVAALLAFVILQNIRILHTNLAQMVAEKTAELQNLNAKLEEKITQEVAKSRQKDEIMFRQSRLAAMGEMMGNIAHQWRQPLNAIVLIIQSFQMKKMLGKLDDDFIDAQVNEGLLLAASMSKTIDDFRNFFKPNKKQEYFSALHVTKQTIDIVAQYYEKLGIKIMLTCKEDFSILGFENEFSQVLMNLFSNAKDALSQNDNPEKLIEVTLTKDVNFGIITVVDNAGGISEEIMDRIFEPYFSTKHKSIGTGIGLHMSKEIIEKQMDGQIEAKNCTHRFRDSGIDYISACMQIKMPTMNKKEE
ncbi:MAG: MCP four helix bundle domain-containing protein [Sulfurospirillum sp.]|nr:MCP four helix bundle domain-containing protein [Sulfurospirillum sp.]